MAKFIISIASGVAALASLATAVIYLVHKHKKAL